MSKKQKRLDTNQAVLDFDAPIQQYENLRAKLLSSPDVPKHIDSYEEACIEIAATVNTARRAAGLSREQMVDAINAYFGPGNAWRLSIHMLNHYLTKPTKYPMPAAMIYAVQHVTGSLGTIAALANAEDGRVIDKDDVRELALGKLDNAISEMQRLKKEFRGIRK
ncbi:MAG: hypothetical protein LLG97_19490 [Deltaproteobacteria bacterium]|nr:hypothetical protein [Deltaproteobacteria bacterium]